MRGPAKIASYIGVGMVVMGFLLIFFAWNFAADLDVIQRQFPYMLSGGVGGLGLIITGVAILAIQTQRQITAERARDMASLQAEADMLLLAVSPAAAAELEAAVAAATAPPPPAPTIGRPDRPQGGFAPAPRGGAKPSTADQPAGVAVLDSDEAWAPAAGPADATTDSEDDRRRLAAALDDVSGVGPAKQEQLLEHFGTYEAARAASVAELADVPGISATLAERISRALR